MKYKYKVASNENNQSLIINNEIFCKRSQSKKVGKHFLNLKSNYMSDERCSILPRKCSIVVQSNTEWKYSSTFTSKLYSTGINMLKGGE